jgi:hypothetical protein
MTLTTTHHLGKWWACFQACWKVLEWVCLFEKEILFDEDSKMLEFHHISQTATSWNDLILFTSSHTINKREFTIQ